MTCRVIESREAVDDPAPIPTYLGVLFYFPSFPSFPSFFTIFGMNSSRRFL